MSLYSISIIITTHNRADLLTRAVNSVLSQTYKKYELHIVDDASSDNTDQIVKPIVSKKDNIYYWRHEKPRGLSAARNTGIAKSVGQYIAFLDDDDEWKPESLKRRIELLENLAPEEVSRTGVVYTGCEIQIVDENRVCLNMPRLKGNIRQAIIKADIFTIPSTCLFSRKALEYAGGFDEGLLSSVDHDIWMNLARHNYYAYAVDEPLTITYIAKDHSCITAETSSRIQGVEQYLNKWKDTLEEWFGAAGGKKYIKRYRRRVLTRLAAAKISEGNWSQAWRLFRHVVSKNNYSPVETIFLLRIVSADFVKKCLPLRLLCWLRKIKK